MKGRQYRNIVFDFTDGVPARYDLWRRGYRPRISRARTQWQKQAEVDNSYREFRRYLNDVFTYAGTYSLSRELRRVEGGVAQMQSGDVFVHGGFPGHAALVADIAIDSRNGRRAFLLLQSFMPAQEMHILKNPKTGRSRYYDDFDATLVTPEWYFRRNDLKRFREE